MSVLPTDQTSSNFADEPAAPLVLPVIEETAVINRELVETGRVRLT